MKETSRIFSCCFFVNVRATANTPVSPEKYWKGVRRLSFLRYCSNMSVLGQICVIFCKQEQ